MIAQSRVSLTCNDHHDPQVVVRPTPLSSKVSIITGINWSMIINKYQNYWKLSIIHYWQQSMMKTKAITDKAINWQSKYFHPLLLSSTPTCQKHHAARVLSPNLFEKRKWTKSKVNKGAKERQKSKKEPIERFLHHWNAVEIISTGAMNVQWMFANGRLLNIYWMFTLKCLLQSPECLLNVF